jgi:hypothetical protein
MINKESGGRLYQIGSKESDLLHIIKLVPENAYPVRGHFTRANQRYSIEKTLFYIIKQINVN